MPFLYWRILKNLSVHRVDQTSKLVRGQPAVTVWMFFWWQLCNVPILIDSLLNTTCNFKFKLSQASCHVPFAFWQVFFPLIKWINTTRGSKMEREKCPMVDSLSTGEEISNKLSSNCQTGNPFKIDNVSPSCRENSNS